MRPVTRLLVAVAAVVLVACTRDDQPVPPAQRFPTPTEAPGAKDDPVETGETSTDLDDFIADFTPALVDPDPEEMTVVVGDAGFERAGLDVLFFGEQHDLDLPHLFSWYIEVGSEDGAASVLDYLEADTMEPCPESCSTVVETFDVEGVPDARGVLRLATEEAVEAAGLPNEIPREEYWVGFSDGSIVYTLDLFGDPGAVTEEQIEDIVTAFRDRVIGE
jgi:hypothetical protein